MKRRWVPVGGRSIEWIFGVLAMAAAAGCGKGTPSMDPPASGYTVSGDGGVLMSDSGTPPAHCASVMDCPPPTNDCTQAICMSDGFCGSAPSPAATLAATQTSGDCRVNLCDGAGGVTSAPDDSDLADDGNGCTADSCQSGVPVFTNRPAGTSCAEGAGARGGAACDGNGQCVVAAPN